MRLRWYAIQRLAALCAAGLLTAGHAMAQEIRGLAKLDARGELVGGASVTLIDSLGREAASTRTDRKGEFVVRAPVAGTYWLRMSARGVGRTASPVFLLDSGMTIQYEHLFRHSLGARVRGEIITAENVLSGPFADSSAGTITRGLSASPVRQIHVQVKDAVSGAALPQAEVALVAIDPRFEQVVGGATDGSGADGWRDVKQTWYRVVARRLGFEPGGSLSFPIVGESDSVSVVLRLKTVTVLDPVTVMARRITSFGFNLNLMSRFYLGGDSLQARTRTATSVDDLIGALRIPGISVATGDMTSIMRYRGQRVRVFILDGSRTSGELPLVEPSAVESLMFIPPNEAGAIFGPDASGGVLIINTRTSARK